MDWLDQKQDNVTEISGHGAGGLISQWVSTMKSTPYVQLVGIHPDMTFECCWDVKPQQQRKEPQAQTGSCEEADKIMEMR